MNGGLMKVKIKLQLYLKLKFQSLWIPVLFTVIYNRLMLDLILKEELLNFQSQRIFLQRNLSYKDLLLLAGFKSLCQKLNLLKLKLNN